MTPLTPWLRAWSAIQLTEELQAVFGLHSAPCLRTVQLWIGDIKDGSFSFWKYLISERDFLDQSGYQEWQVMQDFLSQHYPLPKGETVTADYMVEYLKDTGNRFRNLKKDKIAFKNLSSRWIMQDRILQRQHRRIWTLEQNGVQIVLKVPIAHISTYVTDSSSPGCKNTAGQKEYGNGEELYIDAKRYLISLPEDLLLILHELNKLLEHCRAVIREATVSYI